MPRTVDEAARARRRDEFLDAAQRLIETAGYERMTIQDVLREAGASRGAFYHYFDSKGELLSAVVDRFADTVASALEPGLGEPGRSAVDKLRTVFAELTARGDRAREELVRTLRIWYSEDNVRVRQKVRGRIIDRLAELLAAVVAQGAREGTVDVTDPRLAGRVVATLIQDLNDDLADRFLADPAGTAEAGAVERTVAAYTGAVERVLGIPAGSVALDAATIRAWFTAAPET